MIKMFMLSRTLLVSFQLDWQLPTLYAICPRYTGGSCLRFGILVSRIFIPTVSQLSFARQSFNDCLGIGFAGLFHVYAFPSASAEFL